MERVNGSTDAEVFFTPGQKGGSKMENVPFPISGHFFAIGIAWPILILITDIVDAVNGRGRVAAQDVVLLLFFEYISASIYYVFRWLYKRAAASDGSSADADNV